mmetsp:Transcript_36549/g.104003  ORF Transcript_36549/g.104003 Transcript_36549/m.104003 type:complete len:217 (-) Transcript_36549:3-653(-)
MMLSTDELSMSRTSNGHAACNLERSWTTSAQETLSPSASFETSTTSSAARCRMVVAAEKLTRWARKPRTTVTSQHTSVATATTVSERHGAPSYLLLHLGWQQCWTRGWAIAEMTPMATIAHGKPKDPSKKPCQSSWEERGGGKSAERPPSTWTQPVALYGCTHLPAMATSGDSGDAVGGSLCKACKAPPGAISTTAIGAACSAPGGGRRAHRAGVA